MNIIPLFPTTLITMDVEERTDELKPEDFKYNIIAVSYTHLRAHET